MTNIMPATPPDPGWCAMLSTPSRLLSARQSVNHAGTTAPPTGVPFSQQHIIGDYENGVTIVIAM